jgi:hypothetical protein
MYNFVNISVGKYMIRICRNHEERNKIVGMLISPTETKYMNGYSFDICKFIMSIINAEPDNSCSLEFWYMSTNSKKNKKRINELCGIVDNTLSYWKSVMSYV